MESDGEAFEHSPWVLVRMTAPWVLTTRQTRRSDPVRLLPRELDVRDEARHEDEVDRPLAEDLVGDVDGAAPGVARLRNLQRLTASTPPGRL